MIQKVIRTEEEYRACLDWVDGMFDKKVTIDCPEGKEVQATLLLIKQYEDIHFSIPLNITT